MHGFQHLLDSLRCSYSPDFRKQEERAKGETCLTQQQPMAGVGCGDGEEGRDTEWETQGSTQACFFQKFAEWSSLHTSPSTLLTLARNARHCGGWGGVWNGGPQSLRSNVG